jgi:hypothetical protein
MFKITIRADGISPNAGPTVAEDIEKEFREHRPWHERVTCSFEDGTLTLVAFNDWDRDGSALSDEFSDCLSICIVLDEIGEGTFDIETVEV